MTWYHSPVGSRRAATGSPVAEISATTSLARFDVRKAATAIRTRPTFAGVRGGKGFGLCAGAAAAFDVAAATGGAAAGAGVACAAAVVGGFSATLWDGR